jgi:hypothetical protein
MACGFWLGAYGLWLMAYGLWLMAWSLELVAWSLALGAYGTNIPKTQRNYSRFPFFCKSGMVFRIFFE